MEHIITKPDERFYHIDGVDYPRVTWILSAYPKGEGLNRWMGAQESYESAVAAMERAGRRGTNVHRGIQKLIEKEELVFEDYTEEEWVMLESFVQWVSDYQPEFISLEQTVHSKKYQYAGTYDAIVRIGDEVHLVDWKTSGAIYPSYWLQLAAYVQAGHEMKLFKKDQVVRTAVLRVGTKHKCGYEWKVQDVYNGDLVTFLAVQRVFNNENPKLTPSPKQFKSILSLA